VRLSLPDEHATRALGARLAPLLTPGRRWLIELAGELGAGKTTLVRGLLAALGHAGRVRSPTYTLIEPYRIGGRDVLHLDLYRLADPGELEFLGLGDLLTPGAIALIEWPERGGGYLPPADLTVALHYPDPVGAVAGREAEITPGAAAGEGILKDLAGTADGR
jgi:tRNA threonylcarbamoyladenosine biosynthesis protein TsaE